MTEIELKFQVPADRAAAVRRAVATSTADVVRLQAGYVDTPDRRLARAGLALRLRLEDGRWVQTLKGHGDGLMQRLEHEVPRGAAGAADEPSGIGQAAPAIDLAAHDGTPAGTALALALGERPGALEVLYATDIRRTRRLIRSDGAVIEIALDEGSLLAGERRAAVCEVEFELIRGPAAAVPALAARWVQRHGLWLDVRSKAERGDLLARAEFARPAVHAAMPVLGKAMRPAEALSAMVACCLGQVLPNAAVVADSDGAIDAENSAEHLHQLRVGLRRLRTALRVFGGWAGTPIDNGWEPALGAAFSALGASRDRDALGATLLPALLAAGAPLVDLAADATEPGRPSPAAPVALLRGAAFNQLMLALIGFTASSVAAGPATPDDGPAPKPPRLVHAVRPVLHRLHRQVVRGAADFAHLSEDAQHRVRKRLKRLRYSAEFVGSLFGRKAVGRMLAGLKPAQNALGDYNDVLVAQAAFRARVAADPRAWFALGWLAAERQRQLARAARALPALTELPQFWKAKRRGGA